MQRIETDRLILRQWDKNDADDLLEFCKNKSVESTDLKYILLKKTTDKSNIVSLDA